jgi:hypothetical protein
MVSSDGWHKGFITRRERGDGRARSICGEAQIPRRSLLLIDRIVFKPNSFRFR